MTGAALFLPEQSWPNARSSASWWRNPQLRVRLIGLVGIALSVVILAAVTIGLGHGETWQVLSLAPRSSTFWTVFAVYYLLGPATDWVIYRITWRLPVSGLLALLHKTVTNELVLGYSGEVQFYLWVRRHVTTSGSPFGVIKDVAVLSAFAGNLTTLAMMAVSAPVLALLLEGSLARTFIASITIVVVSALGVFAFRGKIFSLGRRLLQVVFALQLVRIAASVSLLATMWHLLLPNVALTWWITLATLRLMIARLPLIPSKDVLFAGMVVLLFGRSADTGAAMTLIAGLILLTHLVVGAITGGFQLVTRLVTR